jgi:hypothetical protein
MPLDDLLPKFTPLPSAEEMQAHKNAHAGDLHQITVCECGEKQFFHRLGCRCGGSIKWLYMDNSGAILECGVDFSPLPEA